MKLGTRVGYLESSEKNRREEIIQKVNINNG